jgi:hypothetical protein
MFGAAMFLCVNHYRELVKESGRHARFEHPTNIVIKTIAGIKSPFSTLFGKSGF